MPYQVSTRTLPCGASYLYIEGSGVISKADAEYMMTFDVPGAPGHGLPSLVLAHKITSMSREARAIFSGLKTRFWCAVVGTNVVVRVVLNFLGRVLKRASMTRLFASEEEALRWLDERVREEAAGKPARLP